VTIHAPAREAERRLRYVGGRVTPIDEHSCELRVSDDDLEWLALRIAMLGFEAEIHEPPELIAHVRALAERLMRTS